MGERDILHGGDDNDRLFGGDGVDRLFGDDGADELHGGNDGDILRGGTGGDMLFGDAGNDTLHGDQNDDFLYGGDDDDTLHGGIGEDELQGGDGRDTLNGNEGNDLLIGGDDADLLFGGANDDELQGGDGTDRLQGDGGADTLYGGNDVDRLLGGDGADRLSGDDGNDRLEGESNTDELLGVAGDDTLLGGAGNDALHGNEGSDVLDGGDDHDTMIGGAGSDAVNGGSGDDAVAEELLEPVAYWAFNETAGTMVADLAGLAQNATFFGSAPDLDENGPPLSVAPFDAVSAADFPGTAGDEYVAVAHDPAFAVEEATIALWFNADRIAGSQVLFAKDAKGHGAGGFEIGVDKRGRLFVKIATGKRTETVLTSTRILAGAWTHVAVTIGRGGVALYGNGDLAVSKALSADLSANEFAIVIGASNAAAVDQSDLATLVLNQPFDGRIDEVTFFDVVLDTTGVREVMSRGSLAVERGPGLTGQVTDYEVEATDDGVFTRDTRPVNEVALVHLALDEVEGLSAFDPVGLPNIGLYVGEVDLDDPGAAASTIGFDTATGVQLLSESVQYIALEHDTAFEIAAGTIALWFNADTSAGSQTLVSKNVSGIGDGQLDVSLVDGALVVSLEEGRRSVHELSAIAGVAAGQWHHLAFSFGAGMKIYLDGVLVAENEVSAGLLGNPAAFVFGASTRPAATTAGNLAGLEVERRFAGRLDEIALFAVELDAAEIARVMSGGVAQFVTDEQLDTSIDGTDFYQEAEQLVSLGATRAYTLGAGSENPTTLTIEEVRALGGGRPIAVFGSENETLTLTGEWVNRGRLDTGLDAYDRWTDISGTAQALALVPLDVQPDTELASVEPVAHWSFNETFGDTLADGAGQSQDLTVFGKLEGAIAVGDEAVAVPFGGVFQEPTGGPAVAPNLNVDGPNILEAPFGAFSGVGFPGNRSAYLATEHDTEFEVENGTISMWFNAERLSGSQTLLAKDHAGAGAGGHLSIELVGNRVQARFADASGAVNTVSSGGVLQKDTWYQVTFTFGAGGMNLYLDGAAVASDAFTGDLLANREAIVIGASNASNADDSGDLSRLRNTDPFRGRIDEVSFFGAAFSASQVAQLVQFGALGVVE